MESSSSLHLDMSEKYLRWFEIHLHHKRQEEWSDLNDLSNKQTFALLHKMLNTLSQDVRKMARMILATLTITILIPMISFLPKLVKHSYLDFETVHMTL